VRHGQLESGFHEGALMGIYALISLRRPIRSYITAVLSLFATPALADATIYCTGTLINVWLNKKAMWPIAIIVDEETKNVCVIDRGKAGHDPLRPCNVGQKCYVHGVWRRLSPDYVLGEYSSFAVDQLMEVQSR
jgi:hypothetical protein